MTVLDLYEWACTHFGAGKDLSIEPVMSKQRLKFTDICNGIVRYFVYEKGELRMGSATEHAFMAARIFPCLGLFTVEGFEDTYCEAESMVLQTWSEVVRYMGNDSRYRYMGKIGI